MRKISENSLRCFLADLRHVLGQFIDEIPSDIHFISVGTFYFYMHMAFPNRCREIRALMGIVEPFIPIVLSGRNLQSIIIAHESGSDARLIGVEESLIERSKLIFLKNAMILNKHEWEEMVNICCEIRRQF